MNRIAYLVSDYFAPSHTFVRREIAALRKLEIEIIPFTVQSAAGGGEDVQSLLGRPLLDYFSALLRAFFKYPLRLGSSWLLSLRHRQPGARGLLWSQFHFVEAICLARLLSAENCTRLHNHFANSGATVGMIAADFNKIPWSVTLHGISETDFPAGMLLPEKLERADFVACASYFMRAQAMRLVPTSHWPKMHIIRCGVDLSSLPPAKTTHLHSDKSDSVKLLCVGRLSPEKGYFGLLDTLARLAAEGLDFSLTIVGDGPSADEIHAKVAALALSDRVRFTGALPEAETLTEISHCDIFLLPSLMEGLPVVLIEALAMQKAAIASRVAGIPELIEDGRSGLLFTPSDWADLERQLRHLFSDESLCETLGEQGNAIVKSEFDIMIPAQILARLFKAS
ncbi:glycosyltransferase family 4 protein [uncultured Parasphingorhabdus sp.]|uniref:glycosyltransferase family 4 protein n=1 Tax=uncultured Parasphingorhabdus sp. TaxID=2709694 RepID=UPI0030DB1EA3|tara:strand:- start:92804 stop:93991 length:1188 start_codon:yes stop_codon:yes gene_type:complete